MENIFETVINDIAKRVPGQEPKDGDFIGDDGLLHCGKCGAAKQTRLTALGKERVFPIICLCEKQKEEEEKARKDEIESQYQIMKLREKCFPLGKNKTYNFDLDDGRDQKVSAAMRRYAQRWDEVKNSGMGLLLYGPVGTGKTFFAACIANALIDKEVPVVMTSFARIVNDMQGMYSGRQAYLDKLVSYPLLIIDDLGAERGSDYMLEQVYAVVDARYQTGLPLIVTTNIPIGEIKEPQDLKYKRIYDRILEACHPVEITGPSRRRESVKANFAARKNMLGL